MKYIFGTLMVLISMSWAYGQSVKKHPRVLELEKVLYSDLQVTLRDLIPDQPFNLKVSLDPVHRQVTATNPKESLPYYDTSDEIRDEWDDPNKSDFDLLNRVNRISIKVIVSNEVSKEQLADIKQAVMNRIPYVEGRDLIELEPRDWPKNKDHSDYTRWILTIGVVLMLLLGVVYFAVSSVSVSRITRAIKNIKMSAPEAGAAAPAPLNFNTPQNNNSEGGGRGGGFSEGHFQINDTLKMTEIIFGLIKNFENSKSFPTLEDMILIDGYFKKYPYATGALIGEFSPAIREHLISMSSSEYWLKGLTHPTDLNASSLELMNKLMRVQRDPMMADWNHFLILCWRLDKQLPLFLRKVDPSDRLTILRGLPQSVAIQTAREILPGEWATVLKSSKLNEILSPDKLKKYSVLAKETLPLRTFTHLEQYKKDTDLIHFLKTVDPELEKEIYGVTAGESSLESLRPPFYLLLDAGSVEAIPFAQIVSIEEWSLALMNIPKKNRSVLESAFSDKQKFRLLELMKRNDRSNVSLELVGEARERIGRAFHDYKMSLVLEKEKRREDSNPKGEAA